MKSRVQSDARYIIGIRTDSSIEPHSCTQTFACQQQSRTWAMLHRTRLQTHQCHFFADVAGIAWSDNVRSSDRKWYLADTLQLFSYVCIQCLSFDLSSILRISCSYVHLKSRTTVLLLIQSIHCCAKTLILLSCLFHFTPGIATNSHA